MVTKPEAHQSVCSRNSHNRGSQVDLFGSLPPPITLPKMPGGKPKPISFQAGGSPRAARGVRGVVRGVTTARASSAPERSRSDEASDGMHVRHSSALTVLLTGVGRKRSALELKSWIACVLTLDGRDKVTKVLQYTSRLLTWYFAGLATKCNSNGEDASGVAGGSLSLLAAAISSPALRGKLYVALSERFNALYKAFVTSRKAFRMGRSFIELDKLVSMGWGDYIRYFLANPLEGGVGNTVTRSLERFDTHTIHEGDEDEASWDGEGDQFSDDKEEKKSDHGDYAKEVRIPGRPHLPSRISSNVGWGPTTAISSGKQDQSNKKMTHTVSEIGAQMYKPSPTRTSSAGSFNQIRDASISTSIVPSPPDPIWKLLGGSLKLIGLMGFWAFDNISFMTNAGFLDPITLDSTSSVSDPKRDRLRRKKRASEIAGRFYFMGGLAGLYVNSRSLWAHRNGALKEAQVKLSKAMASAPSNDARNFSEAKDELKEVEARHFVLFLAFLKSCCDVMVFSNNPGIDLHLKLRGKKNHEGLHCLGGLVSASTVLYNNFPNE